MSSYFKHESRLISFGADLRDVHARLTALMPFRRVNRKDGWIIQLTREPLDPKTPQTLIALRTCESYTVGPYYPE